MSLFQHADLIAALPGALAIAIASPGHPLTFRGDDQWAVLLDDAVRMRETSGLPEIRVTLGDVVIVVVRQDGEVAAVAAPVGHELMKSLHRALRRFSKPSSLLRTRRPRRNRAATDPAPGAADPEPEVAEAA